MHIEDQNVDKTYDEVMGHVVAVDVKKILNKGLLSAGEARRQERQRLKELDTLERGLLRPPGYPYP